jgi:hypothetical protein
VGSPREAPPAKLFLGLMHRPCFDPEPVLARLAEKYGPVDIRCPPFPFDGSRYYEPEMGPGLVKFFVSFRGLIPQDGLADVKLETNDLESRQADARGRVCNIDPGIVTHYSVILATTKGYAHRVYLGRGVYAEATLLFRRGGQEPLPWTYPDYRDATAQHFFSEARRILLEQTNTKGTIRNASV